MGLYFTPVLNNDDDIILKHHQYCFFNPAYSPPKPEKLKKLQIEPEIYCDSGGYQLYSLNEDYFAGKGDKGCKVIVDGGIHKKDGVQILDPKSICRKFKELNVMYGFTLDYPLSKNATEKEYKEKLLDSFKWAKIMFEHRELLCPETNLLIPLHYLNKDHLIEYYNMMAVLNPFGYAIPVRRTNNWYDFTKVAYCLCFLQNNGVRVIHLFGSCRAEIIVLGAAAIGLKMFMQISFDATSWRTIWGPKCYDPKTLSPQATPDTKSMIGLLYKLCEELKINYSLKLASSKNDIVLFYNV